MARASITSGRDFRRVYRSGTRVREDGVTVWAAPNEAQVARLGLSIRASVGTAVERNRLRRRVREVFRALEPTPGIDVVVQASPAATGKTFQELADTLKVALTRAGVGIAR
ncbi:MAG: ribonuclease protein component [Actinomycetota bacterium]|nr:ribonuclease protein component [Actinomycetota bacterium]